MGLKGAIELYFFTSNFSVQFFFCKEASSMFVPQ